MISPEQALALWHSDPPTAAAQLVRLSQELDQLAGLVVTLRARIKELEDRLAKTSRNSSKPPSTDGLQKPQPKSLRPHGQRPSGGQPGHPGQTLRMVDQPDHIVLHPVTQCARCQRSLAQCPPERMEKRQLFDIPEPQWEITEHRAEIKTCSCGHVNRAAFPEGVNAPTQYGPRVKAATVYLHTYQLLPCERTAEALHDLLGVPCSEGTVINVVNAAAEAAREPVEEIRQQLQRADVVGFDESGCRIEARLQWLHVASTDRLTYYHVHPKRGTPAMDAVDILPHFEGRAIHDFWSAYLRYDCKHGLCNAHHLRELIFVHEQHHQSWAKEMMDCLLDAKALVDQAKSNNQTALSAEPLEEIEKRYKNAIHKGAEQNPLPPPPANKKRGRVKKSKPRNLLERLRDHRSQVLACAHDFRVPFDNNLSERDIRMIKVKLKISGMFKTLPGAEAFCRLRSYISTARKNQIAILEALAELLKGAPFRPAAAPG